MVQKNFNTLIDFLPFFIDYQLYQQTEITFLIKNNLMRKFKSLNEKNFLFCDLI